MKIRVSHRETIQESDESFCDEFNVWTSLDCEWYYAFKKRKIDSLWHIVENDPLSRN